MAAKAKEAVTGTVVRINSERNNANGTKWVAGYLTTADGERVSFTATGSVAVGDDVTVYGEWTEHPKWGAQFKGGSLSVALPVDPVGLVKWLNKNVYSVGPVTSKLLVDLFGTALPEMCMSEPERVSTEAAVSTAVVDAIAVAWEAAGGKLAATTWLMGRGLTDALARAAIDWGGPTVVNLIQEDPYRLIGRVPGFGWETTDALAATLGITGTDRRRVRGALVAAVRAKIERDGWTCVPNQTAARAAATWLGDPDPGMFDVAVVDAVAAEDLVLIDGDVLTTAAMARCEGAVWAALARSREPNRCGVQDEAAARSLAEHHRNLGGQFRLTDEQVEGVVGALLYRVSVITGGAGSGKSQMTKSIIDAFEALGESVHLCAPTGKAAKRLTDLVGRPAKTIHRVLQYNGATGQFMKNRLDQLQGVYIVDEASMIDSALAAHLLSAMGPLASVVFIGDPNQLQPVGAGALLRDVLEHGLCPITRLKTIHRQAGSLKTNSVEILAGRVAKSVPAVPPREGLPPFSPWRVEGGAGTEQVVHKHVRDLYTTHLPAWGFDPIQRAQFITAQRTGPYGTRQLNLLLQSLHQTALGNPLPAPDPGAHKLTPHPVLYVGDKVIQTKNNYDLDVFNGEVGKVIAKDLTLREMSSRVGIEPDPVYPPETHLVTPVVPGTDGRSLCLCPTCMAPNPGPEEPGWAELLCPKCGVGFVATDGTPRPAGLKPPRRVKLDEPVTVSYVVDFYDRTVPFPAGTGGNLELAYALTCHKCVHPDTLMETEEGLLPIRAVAESGWAAGPDGSAKLYRSKVHNPVGPALRITTKRGSEIIVTPDHGVEVWTGEAYERREAAALCVGDWVRTRLGVTIEPVHAARLPAAPEADVRAVRYTVPTEVTSELAEFFGLMVADGTLWDKGFRLLKRHKDVAERFGDHCRQQFGADVRPVESESGVATGYEVNSTFLARWLQTVGGMGPNAKAVPDCILRSSSIIQAEFLRGLFEDATVNEKDGVCDHVEFTTVYPALAKTVHVMLSRFGVVSSLKFYPAKRDRNGKQVFGHYRVYIYGAECATFRDQIGFISQFKRDRLRNCRAEAIKYSLPVSRAEADSLAPLGKSVLSNARFTLTVSRETATRAGWRDRLAWFDDRIATIEQIECESMCVEVPNGNRFLQNGFPWWNCQGSQFPCAVVIVPSAHAFMHNRNWLYTAVTRASESAVVVGDGSAIIAAAQKEMVDRRDTLLRLFATRPDSRPKTEPEPPRARKIDFVEEFDTYPV